MTVTFEIWNYKDLKVMI